MQMRGGNGGEHVSTLREVLISGVAVTLALVATVRLAHRLVERSQPELVPEETPDATRRG
jgi:hypothetical protein